MVLNTLVYNKEKFIKLIKKNSLSQYITKQHFKSLNYPLLQKLQFSATRKTLATAICTSKSIN